MAGLGFEGDSSTQLVTPCVDVLALHQGGQVQLDTLTEVLGVRHANLALVVHLCLKYKNKHKGALVT